MVYGDFLACFPELQEQVSVWTEEDKSDLRKISVVYIPSVGSKIKRRKFTSGNTALDIEDDDRLYVNNSFISQISEGDYFQRSDNIIWRVTGKVDYSLPADFACYTVERVTGATIEQQDILPVKEGRFD